MRRRGVFLVASLAAFLSLGAALAGDLADFESGATSGGSSSSGSSSGDRDDGFNFEPDQGCRDVAGRPCDERPSGKTTVERKYGDPLLPFYALDLSFQSVRPDITALDGRFEAGYGPVAVCARLTHFQEKHPKDSLDAASAHLLLRLKFSDYFEAGAGAGPFVLDGEETNTGFSLALPLRFRFSRGFGADLRSQWIRIKGNSVEDYDASAVFGEKSWFVRVGYRWMVAPWETLDGPYAGISYSY